MLPHYLEKLTYKNYVIADVTAAFCEHGFQRRRR